MLELLVITLKLVVIISCISAVLFAYNYRQVIPLLKLMIVYLIVGAATDLAAYLYVEISKTPNENNLFFFHFFTLFEFSILTIFFDQLFKKENRNSKLNLILIPGIILIVCNSIFLQDLTIFNSNASSFVSLCIMAYSLYYFYITLAKEDQHLQYRCLKWIIIALFIYHSVNLIVLLFSNLLLEKTSDKQLVVYAFRIFVILATKVIILIQAILLLVRKNALQNKLP